MSSSAGETFRGPEWVSSAVFPSPDRLTRTGHAVEAHDHDPFYLALPYALRAAEQPKSWRMGQVTSA